MKPVVSCLSLPALLVVLAGCATSATDVTPRNAVPASPSTPKFTIDESELPHLNAVSFDDLDTTKSACGDLFGYVNSRWLTANPIPPDRTKWGPAQVLVERSLAIQHQIARQAAADLSATGVEKIIGDFYATGMDRAKIDAQGTLPIQPQLDEIMQLRNGTDIASYLRMSAARGQGLVFDFTYDSDFKNPDSTIAYASQGGLGLPDRGYYFDDDKRAQLDAYRGHIAKVLELSGIAEPQAQSDAAAVVAFESRLAKVSRSSSARQSLGVVLRKIAVDERRQILSALEGPLLADGRHPVPTHNGHTPAPPAPRKRTFTADPIERGRRPAIGAAPA